MMPVIRQDCGSGRKSGAGWQYSMIGSPISLSSASVRIAANCAGRSRRGLRAEGFVVVPEKGMRGHQRFCSWLGFCGGSH